jgi:hypothetical protein
VFKFANVNLNPPTDATVTFETDTGDNATKTIELTWTVGDIKQMCDDWFGVPAGLVDLYYNDTSLAFGNELLTSNVRSMASIGAKDGDKFYVARRKSEHWKP